MSIVTVEVSLKDKEPKVHIQHFFDIESLETIGCIIKAHLMLCNIHRFFENLKVVVPKFIREFWRTAKVYHYEVISNFFVKQVLGIIVKLSVKTIAQPLVVSVKAPSSWTIEVMNLRPHWALSVGTQLGQYTKEVWHQQSEDFLADCKQSYHPQIGLKGLSVKCPKVHLASSDGRHSLWLAPNSLQLFCNWSDEGQEYLEGHLPQRCC